MSQKNKKIKTIKDDNDDDEAIEDEEPTFLDAKPKAK